MRKPDFTFECDGRTAVRASFTGANRERGPFAYAVSGQYRRATRWRSEESGRRMRLVVLGEQDLAPRHAQVRGNDSAHPDLLAQRVLHRLRERAPGLRIGTQRA